MMKRILRITAVFAVLCLAIPSSLSFAQPPTAKEGDQEGREGRGKAGSFDFTRELDLTAEQKGQFKEQKYQARLKKMETKNKIRLKELELRHELEKDVIDKETINGIVQELKDLQGKTIEQRVEMVLQMKEILTPEQFEKLQSMHGRKKHRGMMQGGGQKMFHQQKEDQRD